MNTLRISFSSISLLKTLSLPSSLKPAPTAANSSRSQLFCRLQIMNSSSNLDSRLSSSLSSSSSTCLVPGIESEEMDRIVEQMFRRYSSPSSSASRRGKGVAIVWFRNDLRVLDNEALYKAWDSSEAVLPVYCVDPRLFGSTYHFGFPKTGALRAQFLVESLADLKKNLISRGLNLLIQHGKPEEILPSLAKALGAHTVYAQMETCSEELYVERMVSKGLKNVMLSPSSQKSTKPSAVCSPSFQLVWGTTMYHIDDLPFNTNSLPDVYTQFRKSVEAKCAIRDCIRLPTLLGPPASIDDWGCVPSLDKLGLQSPSVAKGMKFIGGESAALSRLYEYFWKKDLLRVYKDTRNGMLGPDYSTKFSPWLASGSFSPRLICEEVRRYEREREANQSTYWVLFELIWRDYFRFLSVKYGNSLFHPGGPRKVQLKWNQDINLFESWRDGRTGYPLIDANMKELSTTGFMSNRGRQIVCSFLVRDMGLDWRMGAEWFETCLLDYDPCSNYGNWTYGAGVGNDPREDRYFSIPKQAQTYDPEGEYVAYWLPQLRKFPKDKRHFPGKLMYIEQVVPLKFGNTGRPQTQDSSARGKASGGRQAKSYRR